MLPDLPNDYVPLFAVLLTVFGTAITAWLGRLTYRVHKFEQREQLWWLWSRELIDHIYQQKAPPHPEPPSGLMNVDKN